MKTNRLFLILLLLPLIALWGCEGDQGPAGLDGADGADGTDGVDGADGADGANGYSPAMCLDCHNDAGSLEIQLSYAQSGHKAGLYVGYAGGRSSCARCHSKQGFIEFMVTGDVSANVPDPAPIDCAACHTVHPGEFGLRAVDPVVWIGDAGYGDSSFDFTDNSNTCATCHQSRRAEPNITNPGETFEITSTHYGPHHGAMGNVYAGFGFAEIAGSESYDGVAPHFGVSITCVDCHMGEYVDGAGGHSWWPSLDSCTGCHAGADSFDIGNVQTDTQALLDELQDLLETQGVIEYVAEDEAWEPIVGTYSMAQAQAFFNWIGLTEDRSKGVHNPPYVNALLTNSIEAITPAP